MDGQSPPKMNERTTVIVWLLKQGISIVVVAVMCFVFWKDRQEQKEASKACNDEIIQIYQKQNEKLVGVLTEISNYMKLNALRTENAEHEQKKKGR